MSKIINSIEDLRNLKDTDINVIINIDKLEDNLNYILPPLNIKELHLKTTNDMYVPVYNDCINLEFLPESIENITFQNFKLSDRMSLISIPINLKNITFIWNFDNYGPEIHLLLPKHIKYVNISGSFIFNCRNEKILQGSPELDKFMRERETGYNVFFMTRMIQQRQYTKEEQGLNSILHYINYLFR